jgi:hypothetical protein
MSLETHSSAMGTAPPECTLGGTLGVSNGHFYRNLNVGSGSDSAVLTNEKDFGYASNNGSLV